MDGPKNPVPLFPEIEKPSVKNLPDSGRLPSLDGWRAVAILMVLVSHFPLALGFPMSVWPVLGKVFDGNLGVRIFFSISGFIITWLLLKEDALYGSVSLRRFYIRRCVRIFPVYYTYLGVLALLSLTGAYTDSVSSWLGALTFTRNVIGRGDSGTIHFWSLAIEEQFYLCWPIAFKLFHFGKYQRRAVVALGLIILLASATRIYAAALPGNLSDNRWVGIRSLFRYADCLALGCLAAFYRFNDRVKPSHLATSLAWLTLIGVLLADRMFADVSPGWAWLVPLVQGLAFIWLMLDSIDRPHLYKPLNLRAVVYIGVLSYSLYVWHFLFLTRFAPYTFPTILQNWLVWIFPAYLCAQGSYLLIEKPIFSLKHHFARVDKR